MCDFGTYCLDDQHKLRQVYACIVLPEPSFVTYTEFGSICGLRPNTGRLVPLDN